MIEHVGPLLGKGYVGNPFRLGKHIPRQREQEADVSATPGFSSKDYKKLYRMSAKSAANDQVAKPDVSVGYATSFMANDNWRGPFETKEEKAVAALPASSTLASGTHLCLPYIAQE